MRLGGFTTVGLIRPKFSSNVGHILRAAYQFDVSMVAIQGDRSNYPYSSPIDTPKTYRHLPVLGGPDLRAFLPADTVPIAVDLVDDAEDLPAFQHPRRAFYIFGPEDGTISDDVLAWCKRRVKVPTKGCLNLGATVNVVLYDRLAKENRQRRGIPYLKTFSANDVDPITS